MVIYRWNNRLLINYTSFSQHAHTHTQLAHFITKSDHVQIAITDLEVSAHVSVNSTYQ